MTIQKGSMFSGCIVALVTPFDKNNRVDTETVRNLARWHLESGTDGILVAGCTGESFTLSDAERIELLETVKGEIGDQIPVLVGTGASSTEAALERTRAAKDSGADGALVITPYGNKPSQHAMVAYFSEIADLGLPVVLYNVPSRTGTTLAPETAVRLSAHNKIVAIKEASGSLDAVSRIIRDSGLIVLSGDDSLTVPMISLGAKGVISTAANLLAADFSQMVKAALENDFGLAAQLHLRLFPVMKALFIQGNPVPLKTAMAQANLIPEAVFRPPLAAMSPENETKLIQVLAKYGVKE